MTDTDTTPTTANPATLTTADLVSINHILGMAAAGLLTPSETAAALERHWNGVIERTST